MTFRLNLEFKHILFILLNLKTNDIFYTLLTVKYPYSYSYNSVLIYTECGKIPSLVLKANKKRAVLVTRFYIYIFIV